MKNTNKPNNSVPQDRANVKPETENKEGSVTMEKSASKWETLKRNYEIAYTSGKDYTPELYALADALAASVINKCLDPQRKTAPMRDTVSDNGCSNVLADLRRGIYAGRKLIDDTARLADKATRATLDDNGNPVTVTADKDASVALDKAISQTLPDGMDLSGQAVLAILEESAAHATPGTGWLDTEYIVRRLSKRVYIHADDSAAYKDDTTTPIQEAFRAVRREIADSASVRTDPRSRCTYIADYVTDPDGNATDADKIDIIYYRSGHCADVGGYDSTAYNGYNYDSYTGDLQSYKDYNRILDRLDLSKKQAQAVALLLRGYSYKAIATYWGVSTTAVKHIINRIRDKCAKIGFMPKDWNKLDEKEKDEQ